MKKVFKVLKEAPAIGRMSDTGKVEISRAIEEIEELIMVFSSSASMARYEFHDLNLAQSFMKVVKKLEEAQKEAESAIEQSSGKQSGTGRSYDPISRGPTHRVRPPPLPKRKI